MKTLTRSIFGNCITCFLFNGRNLSQRLGDLPQERVNPAPPFSNVGIDFAGPMPYRCGKTEAKCYLVVFVCFVTKSIHLSVTKALDTQECMKAIRRFISRRGFPAHIFLDNGTNFIGSLNDLIKLRKIPINTSYPQSRSSGKWSCRKEPTRSRLPFLPPAHFQYLCTRTREALTTGNWILTSCTSQGLNLVQI